MADGVRLPYRSSAFDVALNIAVLHHLSTAERRLKCIQETLRILKPGGRALFYAWAKEQKTAPLGRSGHQFDAGCPGARFICASTGPTTIKETARACPAHAVRDERKNSDRAQTVLPARRANCGRWWRGRRASTSAATTRGTGPWLVLNTPSFTRPSTRRLIKNNLRI